MNLLESMVWLFSQYMLDSEAFLIWKVYKIDVLIPIKPSCPIAYIFWNQYKNF